MTPILVCLPASQATCLTPGPSKTTHLDSFTFFLTFFSWLLLVWAVPLFCVAFEEIFISFEIPGQQLFSVNIFLLHHKVLCHLPTFIASAKKFRAKWMSVLVIVCLSLVFYGLMIMCLGINVINCWFMSFLISWRLIAVHFFSLIFVVVVLGGGGPILRRLKLLRFTV